MITYNIQPIRNPTIHYKFIGVQTIVSITYLEMSLFNTKQYTARALI